MVGATLVGVSPAAPVSAWLYGLSADFAHVAGLELHTNPERTLGA